MNSYNAMDRRTLIFALLNSAVSTAFAPGEFDDQLTRTIFRLADLQSDSCFGYVYSNDTQCDVDWLVRDLNNRHPLYMLTPYENHGQDYLAGPKKPYPCTYVIHLDGSTSVFEFFMNGTYQNVWHSSNESRYGILNVLFVNSNPVEVFTVFPFGRDQRDCPENSGHPEMIGRFVNEELQLDNPTPYSIPTAFNSCQFRISTTMYPPFVILKVLKDKILTDHNLVTGFDVIIMKFIADHYNLQIVWRVFGFSQWKTFKDNRTWYGSAPFLTQGGSDICIGGITNHFAQSTDDIRYIYTKPVVYAPVPDLKPKWKMVYCGFPPAFWCCFVGTITVFPVIFWLVAHRVDKNLSFSRTVFVLVGIVFSNTPGVFKTSSFVFHALEFIWKFFAQHISLAYTAYLAGFVTYRKYEAPIRTPQQLVDSNLPTAAFAYTTEFNLKRGDWVSNHLKKHIITIPAGKFSDYLNLMGLYKNFSALDNNLFVDYTLKHEAPLAQVYDTGISFSSYSIGSIIYRHSHFNPLVTKAVNRLLESGVLMKISSDLISHTDWLSESSHAQELKSLKMADLCGPFYILVIGYCLSLMAFVGEVLVEKYKRRKSLVKVLKKKNKPPASKAPGDGRHRELLTPPLPGIPRVPKIFTSFTIPMLLFPPEF